MREPKPSELRDPQDALRAYLDEMLHLATGARAETESRDVSRRSADEPPAPVASPPVVRTERDSKAVVSPSRSVETAPSIETEAAPAVAPTVAPEAAVESRPAIASVADRFRFPLQCLTFCVGGHPLALPLLELAGVIRVETRLTRLPNMPAEVLGLLQHRERTLRVVDSGALLGIASAAKAEDGHLLLLAAGDWALTCDAPDKVVYLGRDEIQWRTGDADRIRYGTIRESLATLLAPGAICRRLERLEA